ncbi:S4 domain-containing protein [Aphelenchoides bicaudatus]|nr:S4 domain-containing protein [Aphelenchoides bicaudatus]
MLLATRIFIRSPQLIGRFAQFSSTHSKPPTTGNHDDPDLKIQHKELTLKLPSRRLDAVLKRTAGIGTASLEKSITTNCVRVNEKVQKKKAYNVNPDDQIDLWLAPVAENPELARVHHVEVIEYRLGDINYEILVSVDKNFIVKNWKYSDGSE